MFIDRCVVFGMDAIWRLGARRHAKLRSYCLYGLETNHAGFNAIFISGFTWKNFVDIKLS